MKELTVETISVLRVKESRSIPSQSLRKLLQPLFEKAKARELQRFPKNRKQETEKVLIFREFVSGCNKRRDGTIWLWIGKN